MSRFVGPVCRYARLHALRTVLQLVMLPALLALPLLCGLGAWPGGPGAAFAADGAVRTLDGSAVVDAPTIRILEESASGVRLAFDLPTVTIEDVELPAGVFQSLAIPDGEWTGDPGQPLLPAYSRLLAIPDRAAVQVETTVLDEEEYEGFHLIPAQEADNEPFAHDLAAYARDSFGDAPAVLAGAPAVMRGRRVIPLTFSPVRYNPAQGKIRVARRIEVEFRFAGEDLTNAGPAREVPPTDSFDRMYQELVVNPGGAKSGGGASPGPGMWLLICRNDSNVLSRLQPLVDWRKRKGFPVYVATTQETGTTNTAIKSYIQNAYLHWADPPEWVVLAGDADGSYGIPTFYETVSGYNGAGDHPYVQLDGSDYLGDAHVGRLSFQNTSELETIVAKMVNYESNPYMDDTSWFTRSCLVGDPYDSGFSTVLAMRWMKNRLRQIGYAQNDTIFNSPFVSQMSTALNRGDTIFAYRGIMGVSGWGNSQTYSLNNGWKLPFCTVITCDTGTFNSGTSRSEGFLRAGSAANPKGGIGCVGTATTGTHTRFNNCYTYGTFGGMLIHDAWQMGAAHTWGKVNLFLNYYAAQSTHAIRYIHWNNLMGDPAGEIWSGVPLPLQVGHPTALTSGQSLVPVDVHDGISAPCAGALVCLYAAGPPEVQSIGYTDAQGHVDLVIPPATGPMKLTVTKRNRQPYLTDVPLGLGEYVGVQDFLIQDDGTGESSGNGDGIANPAETIELRLQLRNFGHQTYPNINCVLIQEDGDVPVLDEVEYVGSLAAGGSAWTTDDFEFSVPARARDGRSLRFRVRAVSGEHQWDSAIELPVEAPELVYSTLHFYDAGPNGILDPGETASLTVALLNDGSQRMEASSATLSSESRYITVPDAQGGYAPVMPGATQENSSQRFGVTATSDCPRGYLADMLLIVEGAGVVDTVRFVLPVGDPGSSDPLGPDAYGYFGFDNTDTGYPEAPTYQWVEIAPAAGGSGTQVTLGDSGEYQDKSTTVTLPFPFRYYGEQYTTATICSNGWIQMGSTYLTQYRNWQLPSPGGPDGAIAVFWDDLYETNSPAGHVYQLFDAANHRWIVEWYNMRNASGYSTRETFQAIFYDPAYHPTETGDGIIVYQYGNVTNNDSGDGYCTVGIEKPDNTDGLTYTYFNLYPEQCPSVTNGRAIKWIPRKENAAGVDAPSDAPAVFGFGSGTHNPFRAGGMLRFALERPGHAVLAIYDLQGREVRRLVDASSLSAGPHAASWDGRDAQGLRLPAGIYFGKLTADGKEDARKLVLVR